MGDAFSVADLTAAALLYPLFMPSQYPCPPQLQALLQEARAVPAIQWSSRIYARRRNSVRQAAA